MIENDLILSFSLNTTVEIVTLIFIVVISFLGDIIYAVFSSSVKVLPNLHLTSSEQWC